MEECSVLYYVLVFCDIIDEIDDYRVLPHWDRLCVLVYWLLAMDAVGGLLDLPERSERGGDVGISRKEDTE